MLPPSVLPATNERKRRVVRPIRRLHDYWWYLPLRIVFVVLCVLSPVIATSRMMAESVFASFTVFAVAIAAAVYATVPEPYMVRFIFVQARLE